MVSFVDAAGSVYPFVVAESRHHSCRASNFCSFMNLVDRAGARILSALLSIAVLYTPDYSVT